MQPASIAALALAASMVGATAAQPQATGDGAPYSHLRVRAAGARNVNREPLHDFWRAGTGGSASIATPFYLGDVGVGVTLVPFRARDAARPDFRALMIVLDWSFALPALGPVRPRVGARVGDFVMLIENPDVWLDSESELLVGAELSAAVALWRSLSLHAAAAIARVHTSPSLDLALVTVGLEYVTRTPGWLRSILE